MNQRVKRFIFNPFYSINKKIIDNQALFIGV